MRTMFAQLGTAACAAAAITRTSFFSAESERRKIGSDVDLIEMRMSDSASRFELSRSLIIMGGGLVVIHKAAVVRGRGVKHETWQVAGDRWSLIVAIGYGIFWPACVLGEGGIEIVGGVGERKFRSKLSCRRSGPDGLQSGPDCISGICRCQTISLEEHEHCNQN